MAARPHTSPWTTELEDIAKARWQAGESGTTIAKALGSPFTKNAVISLIHRHNAVDRPEPVRLVTVKAVRKPKPKKPKKEPRPVRVLKAPKTPDAKPEAVVLVMPARVAPASDDVARVTFADLQPHHCRWPVGEVNHPEFGFCGEGRIEGKPYCPGHEKRAHVPLKPHQPKTANDLARSLRRWAA